VSDVKLREVGPAVLGGEERALHHALGCCVARVARLTQVCGSPKRFLVLAPAVALSAALVHSHAAAQLFTKITEGAVVNEGRYSEGSSWGDVNNDGWPDLFVPHVWDDLPNLLFLNNGDGTFAQVAEDPVVTDDNTSSGGSFGDFDNDGNLDLFVQNWFGNNNSLYLGQGDGSFLRVTEGSIVNDGGNSFGSSVVDYDGDGNLDVYVDNGAFTQNGEDNFLYRGNGDGTFTRILLGHLVNDGEISLSSGWCDHDDDGDADLLVANGGTFDYYGIRNLFFQNNGDGTFTRVTEGVVATDVENSTGVSWGDYDNDGDFDLFIANWGRENNSLYQNDGGGTFSKITMGSIVNSGGHSVAGAWGDADNDGDLDLFVTNDWDEDNWFYVNNGDGTFTEITVGNFVNDGGRSNGATWADYNRDGFLDLYVPNGRNPTQNNFLYHNNALSGNSWVSVRCAGVLSNAAAVGAKIRATATVGGQPLCQLRQVCGQTGFNAQNSFDVEFGLGDAPAVDSLHITWPSGTTDVYANVTANAFYLATEGQDLIEWPITSVNGDVAHTPSGAPCLRVSPNPLTGSTIVSYSLDRPGPILLGLYDLHGRLRQRLALGETSQGAHSVQLDAGQLRPGTYILRLDAGGRSLTEGIVLVR
jgi:hypothetical protein